MMIDKINELRHADVEIAKMQKYRADLVDIISKDLECKLGGSKAHTFEGFKATIKRPLNLKIDLDQWEAIKKDLPVNHRPVKTKTELDITAYNALAKFCKDDYIKVSQAVTATPGKVSVKLEVV